VPALPSFPPDEQLTLGDCIEDFLLSRRAAIHSPRTIEFYEWQLTPFVASLHRDGLDRPSQITATHVRAFLAGVVSPAWGPAAVSARARRSGGGTRGPPGPRSLRGPGGVEVGSPWAT